MLPLPRQAFELPTTRFHTVKRPSRHWHRALAAVNDLLRISYGFRITRVAAVPVPFPCHSANSNALLISASGKLCEITFDSG